MSKKKYIFDYIPEETDQNQIDPYIGQKSPIIKPKLDDTIPSILNLSSEMSSFQKTSKDDSFNFRVNKNFIKANSLFNQRSTFVKGHYKSFSNEFFSNPNFFNMKEKEKEKINKSNEDDDNSSYYGGELNFDGVINFWGGENNNEENEDFKKGLLIENEIENKIEIEDINEGFNILNMLKNGKTKDKI